MSSKFPAFERTDGPAAKKPAAKTKKRASRVPGLAAIEEKECIDATTPRLSAPPPPTPTPAPEAPVEAAPTLTLSGVLESGCVEVTLPSAPCFVIQEPDPYNGRKKVSVMVVNLKSVPRQVARAVKRSDLDTDRCVSFIGMAPECADLECVVIGYHGFTLTVKRDQVFVSSGLPEPNAALADPAKKLNSRMQARLIEAFRVICEA